MLFTAARGSSCTEAGINAKTASASAAIGRPGNAGSVARLSAMQDTTASESSVAADAVQSGQKACSIPNWMNISTAEALAPITEIHCAPPIQRPRAAVRDVPYAASSSKSSSE